MMSEIQAMKEEVKEVKRKTDHLDETELSDLKTQVVKWTILLILFITTYLSYIF